LFQLSQAIAEKHAVEKEREDARTQIIQLQSQLKEETERRENLEKTSQASLQEKDIIIGDRDTDIEVNSILENILTLSLQMTAIAVRQF
jgi:predicted RNase H-like nuclease (RuvC/YqgF family)